MIWQVHEVYLENFQHKVAMNAYRITRFVHSHTERSLSILYLAVYFALDENNRRTILRGQS